MTTVPGTNYKATKQQFAAEIRHTHCRKKDVMVLARKQVDSALGYATKFILFISKCAKTCLVALFAAQANSAPQIPNTIRGSGSTWE